MTLNFSHRPVFPGHLSDEYDILDILPSDPFGMDISTALAGWFGDFEVVDGGGDEVGMSDASYHLAAELNLLWEQALRLQALPGSTGFGRSFNAVSGLGYCLEGKSRVDSGAFNICGSISSVNELLIFGDQNWGALVPESGDSVIINNNNCACSSEDVGGAPHSALNYALAHLGLRDLLAVEMVCKSLRSVVRGDSLLWRNIHIDQPGNEKITDDVLLQLANRAQGNLQSLSLVECPRITDDGLRRVLESNLKLTKLSVPGSTRLSIEGIVNSLTAVKSMGAQGVKHLRIGGLYGVTMKHFEELKALLGTTDSRHAQQCVIRKPHFYTRGNIYLTCDDDDDRDIDIELCPRCNNLRLVYDCPLELCQGKDHATQMCRACRLCIARCSGCGGCFENNEYEETFCLELLCSVCLNQTTDCEE